METCPKCHAEAWDETTQRSWIQVQFTDGICELPVLHIVNTCRVCGFTWRDARALEENTLTLKLWQTTQPCRLTEGPDPFCVDCGDRDRLTRAIWDGYYRPEIDAWDESEAGEAARWEFARSQVYGCRKVPKDVTP